jgi:LytS/YehU family sensor histidine kinase
MGRAEMKRLRLEKAEAELQFLRTQINPHFLFNTLNNIYSLILSNQNEKAGGMILKLSGIMDYMIHDSKAEVVLLQTEINHIRNYLDLEKIRLTGQDHIDFISETDADDYRIAPFILLPFIENGFKHGISNTINNGYIKIRIHVAQGVLNFKVENSKPASTHKNGIGGIGLQNIRRRLEIIYPGRHELQILDNPCNFNVNLSVRLEINF